jgi:hypothetical protein
MSHTKKIPVGVHQCVNLSSVVIRVEQTAASVSVRVTPLARDDLTL